MLNNMKDISAPRYEKFHQKGAIFFQAKSNLTNLLCPPSREGMVHGMSLLLPGASHGLELKLPNVEVRHLTSKECWMLG